MTSAEQRDRPVQIRRHYVSQIKDAVSRGDLEKARDIAFLSQGSAFAFSVMDLISPEEMDSWVAETFQAAGIETTKVELSMSFGGFASFGDSNEQGPDET